MAAPSDVMMSTDRSELSSSCVVQVCADKAWKQGFAVWWFASLLRRTKRDIASGEHIAGVNLARAVQRYTAKHVRGNCKAAKNLRKLIYYYSRTVHVFH